MRHWGHIDDLGNLNPGIVQGANSGFPSVTRSFHVHLYLPEACLMSCFCTFFGCNLSRVRSVLLGAPESHFSSRSPGDHISLLIGQGNNDIVEGSSDMSLTGRFNDNLALLGRFCSCLCTCLCHVNAVLLSSFLLVSHSFSFSFTGPGIVLGPLAAQWESGSVTDPAVTTNIHEPFDVELVL